MGLRCIAAISSLAALIVSAVPEVQNLTPPDESFQEESLPTPEASAMVEILDYIPDIKVELRYATENNFTGKQIYDFTDARLRYGTVLKLKAAQAQLQQEGLTLLIWDAYRPVSAQFNLWNACPDPVYVANPNTGYSSHSQGNTVDVTIVQTSGAPVEMPTDFDNFAPPKRLQMHRNLKISWFRPASSLIPGSGGISPIQTPTRFRNNENISL